MLLNHAAGESLTLRSIFVPVRSLFCFTNGMVVFNGRKAARRPVSRVLSTPRGMRRPFLWDTHCCAPHATNPGDGTGMSLCQSVTRSTGRPYSVLLPMGFTLPPLSPGARCALAAPFHPCLRASLRAGGLFSVALSLGSPPPAVSRHRIPVEPGLSSIGALPPRQRPSGRLAPPRCARWPHGSRAKGQGRVRGLPRPLTER